MMLTCCCFFHKKKKILIIYEPQHEISNNVVCATKKRLRSLVKYHIVEFACHCSFFPQSLRVCIIYVISVMFMLCLRAHMFIGALWSSAGKGLTSWLSFVMPNCEVVTFPLVSWVRCGA